VNAAGEAGPLPITYAVARHFVNQSHGQLSFLYICSHREHVARIPARPLLDIYAVGRATCAPHGELRIATTELPMPRRDEMRGKCTMSSYLLLMAIPRKTRTARMEARRGIADDNALESWVASLSQVIDSE